MDYELLDKINFPSDLREFKKKDLKQISEELRAKTIETVSKTGGHLGAGLGVVELTVAIHYVFNTPHDKLIWDVGHQAYPHKIVTGRKKNIDTLRKKDGVYGFVRRSESEYDPFGTAHSSTAVSAGLGIKAAKDINKDKSQSIFLYKHIASMESIASPAPTLSTTPGNVATFVDWLNTPASKL